MVGNDVVDLDDPEASVDGLNPRFDQRVFTLDERDRLAASADRHVLRWTFWAAKESAYKFAKRIDPETVFAHSLFEVDLAEEGHGVVRHGEWCCAVSVSRRGSVIHAIAIAPGSDRARVVSGLAQVHEDDPSLCVRELATTAVARHLEREPTGVAITAGTDRIPVLRVDGKPVGHISLSHHGAFAAFAWMPPS